MTLTFSFCGDFRIAGSHYDVRTYYQPTGFECTTAIDHMAYRWGKYERCVCLTPGANSNMPSSLQRKVKDDGAGSLATFGREGEFD